MLASPSLYVHLPWCIRKCPYCDFNSHTAPNRPPFEDYVNALIADLTEQCSRYAPTPLSSIFFGGGTPSLFSPQQVGRVINSAQKLIGFDDKIEITLEANPGTTEYSNFSEYRQAGVNRVSLGVQSFNEDHLHQLGRIHGAQEARKACHAVQDAGINQLNLDLMYGLPEQSGEMALDDLEQAIDLAPSHISHYNLTIEPNTYFAVHPPKLPSSDACFEMQNAAQERLALEGFAQYEVSAYAQNGCQASHNLNYWRFGDYLGIGAGAHGKITDAQAILRTTKAKHPAQYLSQPTKTQIAAVAPKEQVFEFMLNRTRLNDVIELSEVERTTHLCRTQIVPGLVDAASRKLMEKIGTDQWQITALGRRFLNDLQQIFLP